MYPTPESCPKVEEPSCHPELGLGSPRLVWTHLWMHILESVLSMRELCWYTRHSLTVCGRLFPPHKDQWKALSLLWANERGMVCLGPSHAGEWLLIGQRSSTSQRATRTDSHGQRVGCLNGPPLVMWHFQWCKLPPNYQQVEIVNSPRFLPLENVMIRDTLIKCLYIFR